MDFALADWLAAAAALRHADDEAARRSLEALWAPAGDGLAFLSVRSAFDCALTALDWPRGSEVLVSSVNIREMVDLVRLHGLVPIPLPLDARTMQPVPEAITGAVTARTRGLLLAHLFGARAEVGPLFARARACGLVCFEDAAQAFRGPHDRGDALADVSLFSFGTIKTATALGGALARISSPDLRARMAAIQAGWALQRRRAYAAKLAPALLFLALHPPLAYTLFTAVCRWSGTDSVAMIRRLSRGFGGLAPAAFARAIRHRPCAPLLHVLRARLAGFAARTAPRVEARRSWGVEVAAAVTVLGAAHADHTHWLLPVQVANAVAALTALRAAGIDASGPSNVIDLSPASELLHELVFVPAYPELSRAARASLLQALTC